MRPRIWLSTLASDCSHTTNAEVALLTAIRGGPISRDPVPDRFTLCMPSDRLQVDCEVAWRQGPLIGVRYVSPTRRTPRPPPKPAEPVKKPHTSLISLLINPR